jgi:hypothetical protein
MVSTTNAPGTWVAHADNRSKTAIAAAMIDATVQVAGRFMAA